MLEVILKSFDTPDETRVFEKGSSMPSNVFALVSVRGYYDA
jgi:hypothetical protein